MRTTLRGKNIEMTPSLETYVEEKLTNHIDRLLKRDANNDLPLLEVELERSTQHHHKGNVFFVRAILRLGGKSLTAMKEAEDVHIACDNVRIELERQILDFKGRREAVSLRKARSAKKDMRLDPAAKLPRMERDREEGV